MKKVFLVNKNIIPLLGMFILLIPVFISFVGCSKETATSLYSPLGPEAPAAVIDSINPGAGGINGVSTLLIYGKNFSTNLAENVPYFDAGIGTMIAATPTMLTVKAGIVKQDTCYIRIRKVGVTAFSNTKQYILKAAAEVAYPFKAFEDSDAIEFDAQGNMYVSVLTNAIQNNIMKITPAGVSSKYTPDLGGGARYTSLKMGPGGVLYGVRGLLRAVFQMPAGGGVTPVVFASIPAGNQIKDIDFGQNGDIYCAGNNAAIWKIKSDKTMSSFAFAKDIKTIKVYNGNLFAAILDTVGGTKKAIVYKFPIDATTGDLGTPSEYFNYGSKVNPNIIINCIAFTEDGKMFLGTNDVNPIYMVDALGTGSPFYVGLINKSTPALFFSYDGAQNLYYTRDRLLSSDAVAVMKIRTEYQGSKYYGR